MLFNSINYFLFLPAVLVVYYILPDKFRWILILLSSIAFYMIGGAITIIMPVIIILITFFCGKLIEKTIDVKSKKLVFLAGLIINLGLLIFYKYFNFFLATFFEGYDFINIFFGAKQAANHSSFILQIAIPLGISYITFQAIGYLIEIHWGNHKPEKRIAFFATYLLFFPKLLAGPIERAHNFIPQLYQKHEFNYDEVVEGLKRILWGLFKKLVIANRLAIYTDAVFNNSEQHSGITLLIASFFFTVQLFADFSAYTDMAIGTAQMLGYRLMENFDNPFIAKSITEFWRRWHISLSTWVTDYIYNPIVINMRNWGRWTQVFAAMVTFLILGFWHGASWNFIIFGFLHGFMLSSEYLTRKIRKKIRNFIPAWINTFAGVSFTFLYFSFSLIFFKSKSTDTALSIIDKIVIMKGPFFIDIITLLYGLVGVIILLLIGLANIKNNSTSLPFHTKHWFLEQLQYGFLVYFILLIGVFDGGQFIYFQF